MKLKELLFDDVAEIQGAVTAELKKVQKEEFSADFQKLYERAKACIYVNGADFEKKKMYVSSSRAFYLKKKISILKLLDHILYIYWYTHMPT